MSAFGARAFRDGTRLALIALSGALLASCSATTDAPFAFDLNAIEQDGQDAATVSPDMAFIFDENDPALPDTVAERPQLRAPTETGSSENASAATAPDSATASTQQAEAGQAMTDAADAPGEQAQAVAAASRSQPESNGSGGGFLSAFFSQPSQSAADQAAQPAPVQEQATGSENSEAQERQAQAEPEAERTPAPRSEASPSLITTASTGPLIQERAGGALVPMDALPGVRGDSLFEITRRSGMDDEDGDIDLYEDTGSYQVASAAGLARLAPNGLLKQHEGVDAACLRPALVRKLRTIERHFGKRLVVTSGYRSPEHNRRVRGARNSLHMNCAAADIQVPGVSKHELARFTRALPGRGGVGTYCHTESIHVDVGPERDWNWRCSRRR